MYLSINVLCKHDFCVCVHSQPKRTMCGFGLQRSFGRNVLELLVYYLMLNKCKNLKDMKSSCLSVCTSSLYDNEGRYFLHYYM